MSPSAQAINWTQSQLDLFRRMYDFMRHNQAEFVRPSAPKIAPLDWSTIARMAALYAAHNSVAGPSGETRPAELGEH